MPSLNCEVCAFRNPRATVTAVIVENKKLLLAKRAEEPFKGWWDLIGGYMNEDETPEEALKREIKEELNIDVSCSFIGHFHGYASWKGEEFPILSLAYLVELNKSAGTHNEEIVELGWFKKEELPAIAFDSNEKIVDYVKTRGII